MSQARFQKRMREKARQEKAQAKRQRKDDRAAEAAAEAEAGRDDDAPAAPEPDVLAELAELHRRFDAEDIDFDEFEQRKQDLLAQLDV